MLVAEIIPNAGCLARAGRRAVAGAHRGWDVEVLLAGVWRRHRNRTHWDTRGAVFGLDGQVLGAVTEDGGPSVWQAISERS